MFITVLILIALINICAIIALGLALFGNRKLSDNIINVAIIITLLIVIFLFLYE